MAGSNPGFSGFMNGVMNNEPPMPQGLKSMPTQGQNAVPPPANRGGNNVSYPGRNDISMARGGNYDDGISIKENFGISGLEPPRRAEKSQRRPDMKGPSDISDILSGLKTKTINISGQQQQQQSQNQYNSDNNSSTISINDLKDIQTEANIPKRSKKKTKSDKNTVSLDI
jgi:hypothetical protein